VERLGAEQLVQVEIDARPVATEGSAVLTARFDAHARVTPDERCELAVRTERLHFFDLATRRAIRDREVR
jgi:limonene-1,2-epoxide hydrolase